MRQTAIEKAKELVSIFYDGNINEDDVYQRLSIQMQFSHLCAIKLVDIFLYITHTLNVDGKMKSELKYWNKVKQEISKL